MSVALCWIRRDLRIADNDALRAALKGADQVVPVYVLDPVLLARYADSVRVTFLLSGLQQLDADLRARGSCLTVRRGDAARQVAQLFAECGADQVYAEEDYEPYARQRDEKVAEAVPLQLVGGPILHTPGSVLKSDGTPYTVFTPYSRRWKAHPPPGAAQVWPAPDRIPTPRDIETLPLPEVPGRASGAAFPAGPAEAHKRLKAFTAGNSPPIYRYDQLRDRVDLDATSQLSPYLRFGLISARQAAVAAYGAIDAAPDEQSRDSARTWLDELIWREFYATILYHFPDVLEQSFRPNLRSIAWSGDRAAFAVWREGRTGYPIVDAAMRQIAETGWMHNRARMVVASFLVKDLLVDWRWGEQHFMQYLVDGDPAANNGGWQWTAGTGTDAAPYFRVFSPVLQAKRHDPEGDFVRRWVPELGRVPRRYVHAPWTMDTDVQRSSGCVIGRDYPAPIVDHAQARERALSAYRAARDRAAQQAH